MKLRSLDGASVALKPTAYQFGPEAAPPGDFDVDWLRVRGEVRTAAGASWTFHDPCLTTWDCTDLLAWLRAASQGTVAPTDAPSEEAGLLWFTEPNLAFSIAEADEAALVVRVHLSLESAPPRPENGEALELYEYAVPLRMTKAELAAAADEWTQDIALYPAR